MVIPLMHAADLCQLHQRRQLLRYSSVQCCHHGEHSGPLSAIRALMHVLSMLPAGNLFESVTLLMAIWPLYKTLWHIRLSFRAAARKSSCTKQPRP